MANDGTFLAYFRPSTSTSTDGPDILDTKMAFCILICSRCEQINRASLPAPTAQEVRCGNRGCGRRLEFESSLQCPWCTRAWVPCDVPNPRCGTCEIALDKIPLKPRRPSDLPLNPPRPFWLHLGKRRQERDAEISDYHRKVEVFNRVEQRYKELLQEWTWIVREQTARSKWDALWARYRVEQLGTLTGRDFEQFLQLLFVRMGYRAELTPKSGDQGADLRVWRSGLGAIAVQAKRRAQPVGNSAIQELLGGMLYYGCKKGIVATNSTFTKGAKKLAEKDSRIALWNGAKLAELYAEYLADPPPFSWAEYQRVKAALSPPKRARRGRSRL